jgi:hypothetical protein
VASETKSMPDVAYNSGSRLTRLRTITGRATNAASKNSNDDLKTSIEGGIAQVSVMWLLHRGLEVVQDRGESLEKQIAQFSSAAFDAISRNYPTLRNVGRERLWLIYFKGLLNADTHPHEEMVQAIRKIASTSGFGNPAPVSEQSTVAKNPAPGRALDEAELLKHIAVSLGQQCGSHET